MIMVLLFDLASCLMRNGCVHVSIHTHVQLVPNSAKTGESRSLVVSLCVPIAGGVAGAAAGTGTATMGGAVRVAMARSAGSMGARVVGTPLT